MSKVLDESEMVNTCRQLNMNESVFGTIFLY